MPDQEISEHPVRIAGAGVPGSKRSNYPSSIDKVDLAKPEWTAVIGVSRGHFTKPLVLADGQVIQPTGKELNLTMVTVAHWVNGKMDEEYLFWDEDTFKRQLGIE